MVPPKLVDIFFPLTGGCSEGLDAFRFFFKQYERFSMEPTDGLDVQQITFFNTNKG